LGSTGLGQRLQPTRAQVGAKVRCHVARLALALDCAQEKGSMPFPIEEL
jgi:hypothetical protein